MRRPLIGVVAVGILALGSHEAGAQRAAELSDAQAREQTSRSFTKALPQHSNRTPLRLPLRSGAERFAMRWAQRLQPARRRIARVVSARRERRDGPAGAAGAHSLIVL
jgi:hypothetical protein